MTQQRGHGGESLNDVRHTRASALWTVTAVAAVLLLVLVIFIAQNSQHTTVHFFGATWTTPLAVALLLAAVLGALVVLMAGALRIAQLRLAARRHVRAGERTSVAAADPTGAQQPVTDRPTDRGR
jgi:uncharacterized integral membrane protein